MYTYGQTTFDGVEYEIRYLHHRPPAFGSQRPAQLSLRPMDPAYPTVRNSWWNVDDIGRVYWSYCRVTIPGPLADACRLWMTVGGYGELTLKEWLSSLGVLR